MIDRSFSALTVCASLLWAAGLTLVLVSIVSEGRPWGHLGLLSAMLGGVLNIRQFFREAEARERNAFELGRDVAYMQSVGSRN